MNPVIKVESLSKRYRIGLKEQRADTFPTSPTTSGQASGQVAGQLLNVLRAPVDNFRRLRRLSKFGAEDDSVFWALRDINFEVQFGLKPCQPLMRFPYQEPDHGNGLFKSRIGLPSGKPGTLPKTKIRQFIKPA